MFPTQPILGEGNGNPLQRSCLENPRGGRAWWAAVYGVAQSRTQLKRLSISSSSLSCFHSLRVPSFLDLSRLLLGCFLGSWSLCCSDSEANILVIFKRYFLNEHRNKIQLHMHINKVSREITNCTKEL